MRNIIISILCLGILITVWGVYDHYSDEKLISYSSEIEHEIIPDIENKKWDEAYDKFNNLSDNWHKYKESANLFYDTQIINDADYTFAKAKYYIKAKDDSNSTGELNSLKEQLKYLHANESLSIANIL